MKTRFIFVMAVLGVTAGIVASVVLNVHAKPQPPAFSPATNPYDKGIYANGIIESFQAQGANINVYPDVSGRVVSIAVSDGAAVKAGDVLVVIDDSVPRASLEQSRAQSDAALAQLDALKAEPRKETLDVAVAQRDAAAAAVKLAQDQYQKQAKLAQINPQLISKDSLDNYADALNLAQANLEVATRQLTLSRAGAWRFDIDSQQKQYDAAVHTAQAAQALVEKYTIRAAMDGVVLSMNTAVGSYVSPAGAYNAYTQAANPILVMSSAQGELAVRCYIDEILVERLPPADRIKAQMSVRGGDVKIPLQFVRVQPYVSPKISLSDQRQERVDLRVLPVIFKFDKPADAHLYPGQLVDVYVGSR